MTSNFHILPCDQIYSYDPRSASLCTLNNTISPLKKFINDSVIFFCLRIDSLSWWTQCYEIFNVLQACASLWCCYSTRCPCWVTCSCCVSSCSSSLALWECNFGLACSVSGATSVSQTTSPDLWGKFFSGNLLLGNFSGKFIWAFFMEKISCLLHPGSFLFLWETYDRHPTTPQWIIIFALIFLEITSNLNVGII